MGYHKRNELEAILISLLIVLLATNFAVGAISSSITLSCSGVIQLSTTPALHTDGKYIKDSSGNVVVLRGVNKGLFLVDATGGFSWTGHWDATAMHADVDRMASYKINCVRVLVSMDYWLTNSKNTWNGANTADRGFVDCLKDYITYCLTKGIYVMIEPWQIRGPNAPNGGGETGTETPNQPWGASPINTQADYVAWWLSVATGLKSYPNVIFGLWNEPHGDANTFLNAAVQAVAAIRTQTNTIVFIQNGYAGSMDFAPSFMMALAPYGNCGVSNHIYRTPTYSTFPDQTILTKDQIKNYLFNHWSYNQAIGVYPVIIGELGAWIEMAPDEQTWHQNMLAALKDWGTSYTCWIWDQDYSSRYGLQNSQSGSLTWGGQDLVNAVAN